MPGHYDSNDVVGGAAPLNHGWLKAITWATEDLRDRPRLAQRHMDGLSIGTERAQAIEGKIDTFTDAHAGVTQQQDITQQFIPATRGGFMASRQRTLE